MSSILKKIEISAILLFVITVSYQYYVVKVRDGNVFEFNDLIFFPIVFISYGFFFALFWFILTLILSDFAQNILRARQPDILPFIVRSDSDVYSVVRNYSSYILIISLIINILIQAKYNYSVFDIF